MSKEVLRLSICILCLLFINSQVEAEEITFTPRQDYKGDMFVTVNPGQWGCDPRSNARIIWGPWQTEEVPLHTVKSVAIKFEKKKRDAVPLTVVINGCDKPVVKLEYGEPEPGKYLIKKPKWSGR